MTVWCLIGTYQFKTPESSPPGTPIGRIKASDADVGENAEIEYSITDGEGQDMFDVITDQETQEGIITVKKVMALLWKLVTTPGAEDMAAELSICTSTDTTQICRVHMCVHTYTHK